MLDDIMDFFAVVLLPIIIIGLLCLIPIAFYAHIKQEETIKECYMQEIKTKQCEYELYRYEHRDVSRTRTTPVPIFIGGIK